MSDDLKRRHEPDGSLKYRFGSIAIHVIDVGFADRMASVDLPLHMAHKHIPHLGEAPEAAEQERPNGFKFE